MTFRLSQKSSSAVIIATVMLLSVTGSAMISLSGCGSSEPVFDKATEYTPESLASEFLFRYKGMNIKAKRAPAPAKRNRGKLSPKQEEQLATKSKEQTKTKKAATSTLEELLDDIAKKAETVKSSTPSQVLREMASFVAKSTQVPVAVRKILVERVEGVASSFD